MVVDSKHYLEVRLPKLTTVTFAPCARLKRDCAEIGRAGGRLVCLYDPRVSITAPPGAVKCDLPFTIQVSLKKILSLFYFMNLKRFGSVVREVDSTKAANRIH